MLVLIQQDVEVAVEFTRESWQIGQHGGDFAQVDAVE